MIMRYFLNSARLGINDAVLYTLYIIYISIVIYLCITSISSTFTEKFAFSIFTWNIQSRHQITSRSVVHILCITYEKCLKLKSSHNITLYRYHRFHWGLGEGGGRGSYFFCINKNSQLKILVMYWGTMPC